MKQNSTLVKGKIKAAIAKKVIATAIIAIAPALFVLLLLMLFMQGTGINKNPIAMAKGIDIPAAYLTLARQSSDENGIEFAYFLTLSAEMAKFNPDKYKSDLIPKVLERAGTGSPASLNKSSKTIYNMYSRYYNYLNAGPIPNSKITTTRTKKLKSFDPEEYEYETSTMETFYSYSHYDDFGAQRTFGGNRAHEGNDLIASAGVPIVSISEGIVRDMNWNDFGGNIVGVITGPDTYFYYAHVQSFNPDLHEGDYVNAGDLLGYVGNSGYGPLGTTGMFVNHLHLQIGIKIDGLKERFYVSPYNIVTFLDDYRVTIYEEISN